MLNHNAFPQNQQQHIPFTTSVYAGAFLYLNISFPPGRLIAVPVHCLSTAFPSPSPSSRLCVPQLHPFIPCPLTLSPQLGSYPYPSTRFLSLSLLSYPYPFTLLPLTSTLLSLSSSPPCSCSIPLPLPLPLPLPHSPLIILLNYLLSILPLSPSTPPPLHITIAGQFLTAGFLFPLSLNFFYPRFLYPYPLIPP